MWQAVLGTSHSEVQEVQYNLTAQLRLHFFNAQRLPLKCGVSLRPLAPVVRLMLLPHFQITANVIAIF